MNKYAEYKETGIEWIGEIPNDWTVKKIKHKCSVKARVGWKGLKSDEFLIKGYSYLVTGSDFKKDTVVWKDCYQIDQERYEEDPYIQLQEEDLLITKDGTIGKLAIVKKLDKPACLNSGIFVVRPTEDDFTTKYLFWLLKSKAFTQFNDYTSYGSTIQHLYQNVFVEFWFPFPTLEVQTQIANYLDSKTAEIDNIIAAKKKLIALYEEEKAAIINQAVTKGINPDVKLKPSGVEWLGDIPVHWKESKLKYETEKIGDGIHTTPKYVDSSDFHFINGNNFESGKIKIKENTRSVSNHEYEKYKKELKEGTVLISINGTIGKLAIYNNETVVLGKSAAYIECKSVLNNMFLFYLLQTHYVKTQFDLSYSGSTINNLSLYTLHNLKIALPEIEEQVQILNYLEIELDKYNNRIGIVRRLINLLTEYRTTLISEVVTGKIKVTA